MQRTYGRTGSARTSDPHLSQYMAVIMIGSSRSASLPHVGFMMALGSAAGKGIALEPRGSTVAVCPGHDRSSGEGREQPVACVGRPVDQDQGGVVLESSVLVGEDRGGEPAQCFGRG